LCGHSFTRSIEFSSKVSFCSTQASLSLASETDDTTCHLAPNRGGREQCTLSSSEDCINHVPAHLFPAKLGCVDLHKSFGLN